jgi:hypothetical protein
MNQAMKNLMFFILFIWVVYNCNAQDVAPGQQRLISEAELKQKIFSAGRGEAVHIDLIAPAEKKEHHTEVNTTKGQTAIANYPAQPVSATRKNKTMNKLSSAKKKSQAYD